jgi:hypothetical protein
MGWSSGSCVTEVEQCWTLPRVESLAQRQRTGCAGSGAEDDNEESRGI